MAVTACDLQPAPPAPVRGAGGGGKGGGRAPVEAQDTLRSNQRAEVLDLVCEGPIRGLVNGLKSVYLDGVPIEDASGNRNFELSGFAYTLGTQGQAALQGFDSVQSEQGVMVKVVQATPIVRNIGVGAANKVRVTVGIPQLTSTDATTGDLYGSQVEFAIDIQTAGGGYVESYRKSVRGKTMSRYQLGVVLDLPGAGPWEVRVRRVTADSASAAVASDLWWDSFTEIQSVKLRHPNRACFGVGVLADQFSRIPTRAYDILGMVIQVPSNYDTLTRTYTGTWDGTFKPDWTNNPAWVFYDMVVHPRYGLRRYVPTAPAPNKWELYKIARYCDELVPDGYGGMEPRFTCNLYLQEAEEAYKVLQDLAAVFRGILSASGNAIGVVQDAPSDAVSLFTPANVVNGVIAYEGTRSKLKKSGCVVWWNNLANLGKREPELWQDPDLVAKHGVANMELSPLGLTSRGQALRVAKWAVYSEVNEGEIVKFKVGSEGALVPLGRVFKVADPSVAGERMGGRISAATTSAITLDADVTLQPGEGYTLSVVMPSATNAFALDTLERVVSNGPGTMRVLTLASPLPTVPVAEAVWVLQSTAVAPTTWRCISVKEVDGDQYELVGVAHDVRKYDAIEQGLKLEPRTVSRLRETAPKPTDLGLVETVYTAANAARSKVTVSWLPAAPGLRYRVAWRSNSGPWMTLPEVTSQTVDLPDVPVGQLDVTVRAVSPLGPVSQPLEGALTVTGRATGPTAPTLLTVTMLSNGMRRFAITLPVALPNDVAGVRMKVNSGATLAAWTAQSDLTAQIIPVTASQAGDVVLVDLNEPAQGVWSFAARLVDTSGAESAGAAVSANVTVGPRYTGDLNATYGAPAGTLVAGVDAATVRDNAANALANAATAQGGATSALSTLATMRSNGYLDAAEKPAIIRAWTALSNEQAGIQAQATAYGITTELSVYNGAIGALASYLSGLSPAWADTTTDTAITPATDQAKWADAYGSRQALLNKIAAVAGTLANWSSVSGTGKPADNATSDITLIAGAGMALAGNRAVKTGGSSSWDAQVYSLDGYTGGAFASGVMAGGAQIMFGLNTDPLADASYTGLDYAIHCSGNGNLYAFENGTGTVINSAWAIGDVLSVAYDGYRVQYLQNGIVRRSVVASTGLRLYFDSSFYAPGDTLSNIRFVPQPSVAGIGTGQLSPGTTRAAVEISSSDITNSNWGVDNYAESADVLGTRVVVSSFTFSPDVDMTLFVSCRGYAEVVRTDGNPQPDIQFDVYFGQSPAGKKRNLTLDTGLSGTTVNKTGYFAYYAFVDLAGGSTVTMSIGAAKGPSSNGAKISQIKTIYDIAKR